MSGFLSNIVPTLDALGIWAYWIIGLSSLLEGWWLTGVVVPGTLVVDAGGALVRLGHLDFFDMVWFVAIGAIIGGEISWHSGRWLGDRLRLPDGGGMRRAQELLRRHGALALLLGRFLGPVSGFASLAAALSDMNRRRFILWNILSGCAYAIVHVSLGFVAGDILARLMPYLPRLVLPLALLAALILATWLTVRHARRGAPLLLAGLAEIRRRIAGWPPTQRFVQRHPRLAGQIGRRLDPAHGGGLRATAIVALLVYLVALFVDGALDLELVPGTRALDLRVANLAHAYWTPAGLALAGWFTQAGHVPVAALMAVAGCLGFLALGRTSAALGLAVSVIGNATTVTLLKLAFGRARPDLAYFLETSNSFPSGHAAISVALYATFALLLWRERLIGPTVAIIGGVAMAAGLGFTRIFLVEHYLSDVLNGWLIGAIWMVIGFSLTEGARRRAPRPGPALRVPALVAMLASLAGAGWFAVADVKSPAQRNPPPVTTYSDLPSAIASPDFPLSVVTLSGEVLPPVSVVTRGVALSSLEALFKKAGWVSVPDPSMVSVFSALAEEVTDRTRRGATVPLAFRDAKPAAATLVSPASDVVVRIWSAGATSDARAVLALALAPRGDLEEKSRPFAARDLPAILGGEATTVSLAPARAVEPDGRGQGGSAMATGSVVLLDLGVR